MLAAVADFGRKYVSDHVHRSYLGAMQYRNSAASSLIEKPEDPVPAMKRGREGLFLLVAGVALHQPYRLA